MVYDSATGRVVHVHQHFTYPGGRNWSASEIESHALAVLARSIKADVSGFHVLHVKPGEYQEGALYRIEPESRQLITLRRATSNAPMALPQSSQST
jgi:hypothetical protein